MSNHQTFQEPPPAYKARSSVVTSDSKHVPLDQSASASTSAAANEAHNLSYHVYTAGQMLSKDLIITGDDKNMIAYYLETAPQMLQGWNLTLRQGGAEGPPVCHISKESFLGGSKFSIQGVTYGGWNTTLARTGMVNKAFEFTSMDAAQNYKWKPEGFVSGDWVCVNVSKGDDIVAKWRKTVALTKRGQLVIMAPYAVEEGLIVATALAVEEAVRDRAMRTRGASRRAGAMSGGHM